MACFCTVTQILECCPDELFTGHADIPYLQRAAIALPEQIQVFVRRGAPAIRFDTLGLEHDGRRS